MSESENMTLPMSAAPGRDAPDMRLTRIVVAKSSMVTAPVQ